MRSFLQLAALLLFLLPFPSLATNIFRVATYNLENYLDAPAGTRPPKSSQAKTKIRESILAMRPDVLALQEVGTASALLELRQSLERDGMRFPFWEQVRGYDTNIHLAVLSRFPIIARRSHTNENFLLAGRRFQVSRGFVEIDLQANPRYTFTLFAAHLKSRRPVHYADEAELREQEAILLREKIDARLARHPNANLIVLGDFNDVKDSTSTRVLVGRGRNALIDTRPAERNGDDQSNPDPRYEPRHITWTYYYGKEDTYSRIDYILLSRGMSREWLPRETYVLALPNWGIASDHRPIVAGFIAEDR